MPDTPLYLALSRTIKRTFLILIVVFFMILLGFYFVINDIRHLSSETVRLSKETAVLTKENENNIDEYSRILAKLQESRVSSCRQTYTSIYEVFVQFFPDEPRSEEEQANVDKFTNTIKEFREGCVEQTSPEGE